MEDNEVDLWNVRKLEYLRDKMHAELSRRDPSHPKTEYGEWDHVGCTVCDPHVAKSENLSKAQFK
jgi:coenzyme F420-reducing hydrogenase beta subunit